MYTKDLLGSQCPVLGYFSATQTAYDATGAHFVPSNDLIEAVHANREEYQNNVPIDAKKLDFKKMADSLNLSSEHVVQ